MPSAIVIRCEQGKLSGKEFYFDERAVCILGRSPECNPNVPDDKDHRFISRHHCLFDINPPNIRIRDFGSLNGTFVNGEKIGQRNRTQTPEEAATETFSEYDLKDGDKIKLGDTVFCVSVTSTLVCANCAKDLPDDYLERTGAESQYVYCEDCIGEVDTVQSEAPFAPKAGQCASCGRGLPKKTDESEQGERLCDSCKKDPSRIIEAAIAKSAIIDADAGTGSFHEIADYEVGKKLGQGGMGAVYLAYDKKNNRDIALKVMLPKAAAKKGAIEMFMRETENTRALDHPNVVKVYDSGYSNGTCFLSLEYCDGGSVYELVKKSGGKIPIDEAVSITMQILDALEYAHTAEIPYVKLSDGTVGRGLGLVHRDIKPKNIFLCGSGPGRIAKLGDYGLSKAFDMAGLSGLTWTGVTCGSPHFLPRQQVINFKYAKPEVDVWATAASFYNMLTGKFPRKFPKSKDTWQVVLQDPAVPIRKRNPDIPKGLAEVIDRALLDEPEIQFKSAAELKNALEEVL